MAYFQIADFRGGLDTRRSIDLAPPGSLRVLQNAFINDGGEIEKRKAFVADTAITSLLQGATVEANIAAANPAMADDRPIGPFSGLTDGEVAFCGEDTLLWAGALKINESVAGLPAPTAHYTQLLTDVGASIGFISRLKTRSVTEFDGSIYLLAEVNGAAWHYFIAQAAVNPATTNRIIANDGLGDYVLTHRQKIYTVTDDSLRASHLGEPTNFVLPAVPPAAGGFLTLLRALEDRIGEGKSLAPYFSELAVFGERGIQFWSMDPDPEQNQYQRTLPREGIVAPRAVRGFGDGDVVFLARSGIRSLQARDSSNLARVGDIGSPIDNVLRPLLQEATQSGSPVPEAQIYIHRLTGQLWVVIGGSIYVLSNHPESKVLAWSEFVIPSPTPEASDGWIEDVAEVGGTLMVRNRAREVFVYGGPLFDQYDDAVVVMETPHLSFGTPGHHKAITGIDVGCKGEWMIEASFQAQNVDQTTGVENPIAWEEIARIKGSTYDFGRIPIDVSEVTHIAIRATSLNSGEAKLGEILVHFDQEDAE